MTGLLQELRFVLRSLAKRRLYTAATVVVFALAIGANSTVFGVLNGLLLRPLPYPDDDRLVIVHSSYPRIGIDDAGTSIPDHLDRREEAQSLESLAMIIPGTRTWQGIVLIVVLIACANVMNLQLARTTARRPELAIRTALGASRWRVGRLVLAESIALATIGAVLGLGLAAAGLELVRALGLDRSPEGLEFALDRNVLAFTAATALTAASISCLFPVIAFARDEPVRGLNAGGRRGSDSPAPQRFRNGLVIVQIGAGLALISGAGLLAQSFYRLLDEGPGFDARDVLSVSIALPADRYATPESRTRFYAGALDAIGALPGVTIAGLTSLLPFSGLNAGATLAIDGYTPPPGGSPPVAQTRSIAPDYLASIDVPVIEGRGFAARETERVAIVDEVMASTYWPDGDALGQRVGNPMDPENRWYTVVGVVPFVKHGSLTEGRDRPTVYYHYAQSPPDSAVLTLRTSIPPELVAEAVRAAIARLDPTVAVYDAMPLDVRVRRSLGPQRTPMVLTVVFAALAFVLAVVGIYGVLTSTVTQRVGEIGVRMALGARMRDVERLIIGQGARMIAAGLALGVGSAVVLGRILSTRIDYVADLDARMVIAAAATLAIAALLASRLPARRASRIAPMDALRG